MEVEISSDLLYFKENNWVEWVSNVIDKNIGSPFIKKVDDISKAFSHILSLFSLTGISCEEYKKALLKVLLKKLNSVRYFRDPKTQEEVEVLKKTLKAIKQAG